MATLIRVKYLKPHGDQAHCTYGALSAAEAAKLEAEGVVQIRGVVSDAAFHQVGLVQRPPKSRRADR